MATRFRLYSTDVAATLTPSSLGTPPATLISWTHDPIRAGITEEEPDGRGAVIATGNLGTVFHDLGVPDAGGTLTISGNATDGEWLTPAVVASFRVAYKVAGAEWYLTDGIRCWKVRWRRQPAGFKVWMDQFWAEHGKAEYSYEFTFVVVEQMI